MRAIESPLPGVPWAKSWTVPNSLVVYGPPGLAAGAGLNSLVSVVVDGAEYAPASSRTISATVRTAPAGIAQVSTTGLGSTDWMSKSTPS
jgi:hypothetical protein